MNNIETEIHQVGTIQIAELISNENIISSLDDTLDLVGNLYYQGFDRVIIYEKNIIPSFFDLKTGLAGEILQKFSNCRLRLAIVGDFSTFTSKSLQDFILESNHGRQINFVVNKESALQALST